MSDQKTTIEQYLENWKIIDREIHALTREMKREAEIPGGGVSDLLAEKIKARDKTRADIERMLDCLPPKDSLLIRLFYLEGKSCQEIMEELNVSERHFFRAKKNILKKMQFFLDTVLL